MYQYCTKKYVLNQKCRYNERMNPDSWYSAFKYSLPDIPLYEVKLPNR